MILVGMSLDKVAFLRFNVFIAEEVDSLGPQDNSPGQLPLN